MAAIVRVYEGRDLIISAELIEELGIKPGDEVEIQPVAASTAETPKPEELGDEERARRLEILRSLRGMLTDEEVAAFEQARREMWATWQPRNWS